MKLARIYVFGDSQTYGAWDSEGGWCDRIKRDMHALSLDESRGVKFQVFNLGIGGEHSRALSKRIKNELDARYRPDWPPVIIIATGENDTRYKEGEKPAISISEYRKNLEAIINIAREYTDRILLVGLTLTELEVQPFKDTIFSHSLLRQYDQVMAEVADEQQLAKIDMFEGLSKTTKSVLYKDGVHLNDTGHKIIAGLVKPELLRLLGE